ncbi:MAG: tetratricopeptide repeat protein, partial [Candidatus Cryptobacteroides sp.]
MKRYLWILLAIAVGCSGGKDIHPGGDALTRKETDSLIYANRNIDSLSVLLERFASEGNTYGEVGACRELGRCLRDASRFEDAIDIHKRGLKAAGNCCDTLQIIQALNNIGTDYRRMGILEDASTFHYKALTYSDLYSDKSSKTAIKNRVVSLNGIGNVQLTLGDLELADSAFRTALAGERSLGSDLGQAINYANIGAILEEKGQKDSALFYYGKSLEYNEAAGSKLGISLCHSHFGRILENDGDYDGAIAEYEIAHSLMNGQSDIWHALESGLALSRVNIARKDWRSARKYLEESKAAAHKINSREHLSEVYRQEYLLEKSLGNSDR